MYNIKHFGIIIENPKLNMDKYIELVKSIYSINLIPIIILQEGFKLNNYISINKKIEYFKNYFPELREDNFYLMPKTFNFFDDRSRWKLELKKIVEKINVPAFGYTDFSVKDKVFIVNLNKYIMSKNKYLYMTDFLDTSIADLFTICDIINVECSKDKRIKTFDPYINYLFKDRQFDEIYYDDNNSTIFQSKINTKVSNKAFIVMTDEKYLDIIAKYDLGRLLHSSYIEDIEVEDKDIDAISSFLGKNNVDYTIEVIEKANNNKNTSIKQTKVIRKNITCLLYTSPSPRDYGESRMPSSA